MTSFNGFCLDVLGSQQLIFESCDIGNALLLEGLQSGIKCFLQINTEQINGERERKMKKGDGMHQRYKYLLGE